MTKKRTAYKTYPKEFKLKTVRLMRESDKPAAEIARELGLRRNQLYKWAEQLQISGDQAFKGRGRPKKEDQADLSKLKSENERLKEEVQILKNAAAYFARDLK